MTSDAQLPDTMTLKPSRQRWLLLLIIALILSSSAIWAMSGFFPVLRWVVGGFFGLAALIAIANVLGVASSLTLDREGFTARTLFRSFRRTWDECSRFEAVKVAFSSFVGFSSWQDNDAAKMTRKMNQATGAPTGMLPDNYGLTAAELADLMNRFRARGLAT